MLIVHTPAIYACCYGKKKYLHSTVFLSTVGIDPLFKRAIALFLSYNAQIGRVSYKGEHKCSKYMPENILRMI